MADETWQQAPIDRLADHIELTHHAYLKRELPLLYAELGAQVRKHWRQYPDLLPAHAALAQARAAIEEHLMKEETAGFPLIRKHAVDAAVSLAPFTGSVPAHVAEHAHVTDLFAQVRAKLWSYQPPADVDAELAALCQRLAALDADLAQHIHLENTILFPRAQALAG